MRSNHGYVHVMVCQQCRTTGKPTEHPDRAERFAKEHNQLRHGGAWVADVETRRAAA